MKACDVRNLDRGFTLIEMLTVVAIFGLVTVYVGRILVVNERAYHTVEQTSESQQNLRLFGELVEDDIRHAGMMVPRATAVCGLDATTAPDVLYVSDAAAIDPQDDFDPYPGAAILGGVTNLTSSTLQLSSLVIEPSPPNRPAYDTNGDGNPDSDFRVNAGVIVADAAAPDRGTACGRITNVDLANQRITVVAVTNLAAGAGTNLVAVPANEYRLSGTQLLWNNVLLADGIEDFQVAYVFDLDDDNVIDAGEEFSKVVGGTAYDSETESAEDLRELIIGLVSRARLADPAFVGRPQAFLNRTPVVTADGFRRRTLETRVRLRNLVSRIES
jgi:prepilin-type N-terminal cleavage/methylation domain-containing protein